MTTLPWGDRIPSHADWCHLGRPNPECYTDDEAAEVRAYGRGRRDAWLEKRAVEWMKTNG
jgi:hypothetical protein